MDPKVASQDNLERCPYFACMTMPPSNLCTGSSTPVLQMTIIIILFQREYKCSHDDKSVSTWTGSTYTLKNKNKKEF